MPRAPPAHGRLVEILCKPQCKKSVVVKKALRKKSRIPSKQARLRTDVPGLSQLLVYRGLDYYSVLFALVYRFASRRRYCLHIWMQFIFHMLDFTKYQDCYPCYSLSLLYCLYCSYPFSAICYFFLISLPIFCYKMMYGLSRRGIQKLRFSLLIILQY